MIPFQDCCNESLNCFNKLKKEILNGNYIPGEKLSMAKLKKDLQLGQSPIREALSQLLAKNLVELEENKGFHVTTISEKDLRDLTDTILQIENITLRQALRLGNDSWEVNLVATFHQLVLYEMKKVPLDHLSWLECNFAFQRFLILGCNSDCLIQIHDLLFLKLERYLKLGLQIDRAFIEKSHQRKKKLFEAALRRDADESWHLFTDTLQILLDDIIPNLTKKNWYAPLP